MTIAEYIILYEGPPCMGRDWMTHDEFNGHYLGFDGVHSCLASAGDFFAILKEVFTCHGDFALDWKVLKLVQYQLQQGV